MRSNSALLRILGVALSGTAFACSGTSPLAPSASTDSGATAQKTAPYTASSTATVAGPHTPPILPVYVKGLVKATLKGEYILDNGTRVLVSDKTPVTLNGKPVAWWEVAAGQGLYAEGTWVTDGDTSRHGVFQANSVQATSADTGTVPHTTPDPSKPGAPPVDADAVPAPPADPGTVPDPNTGSRPDPTTNRH